MTIGIKKNSEYNREKIIIRLLLICNINAMIKIFIEEHLELEGDNLEIFPSHLEDRAWRTIFFWKMKLKTIY